MVKVHKDKIYRDSFRFFLKNTNETNIIGKMIAKYSPNEVRSVLDIGGGSGRFARLFQKRIGNILAIEPNTFFASDLRRQKIRVIQKLFESVELKEKFDLIIACHVAVFFSSDDLVRQIKRMQKLLTSDGRLLLFFVDGESGEWRKLHNELYAVAGTSGGRITHGIIPKLKALNGRMVRFKVYVSAQSYRKLVEILKFSLPRIASGFDDAMIGREFEKKIKKYKRKDGSFRLIISEYCCVIKK